MYYAVPTAGRRADRTGISPSTRWFSMSFGATFSGIKSFLLLSWFINEQTVRRVGLAWTQARVEAEQGRAVGAPNRGVAAHGEVNVRVIVGRLHADALDLLDPDADLRHGIVVPELGIGVSAMALRQLALDAADLHKLMLSRAVRQHAALDKFTEHHQLLFKLG